MNIINLALKYKTSVMRGGGAVRVAQENVIVNDFIIMKR